MSSTVYETMPLVLFAGGKSSRMGRDKSLLPFAGYESLSLYQQSRFLPYFKTVYISSKTDKFDFDANVILDRYEVSSPLVGIVSVFETLATVEKVFILSVDAPFVSMEIIDRLYDAAEGYDAVIAKTKSGRQPLCGLYKRSVLSSAKDNLEKNDHRIGNLLEKVNTKVVFFEEDGAFANLNHPHEYEEALHRLS